MQAASVQIKEFFESNAFYTQLFLANFILSEGMKTINGYGYRIRYCFNNIHFLFLRASNLYSFIFSLFCDSRLKTDYKISPVFLSFFSIFRFVLCSFHNSYHITNSWKAKLHTIDIYRTCYTNSHTHSHFTTVANPGIESNSFENWAMTSETEWITCKNAFHFDILVCYLLFLIHSLLPNSYFRQLPESSQNNHALKSTIAVYCSLFQLVIVKNNGGLEQH